MRFLAFVGFLAICVGLLAAAFFFGGFYNVGVTAPEPAAVAWSLERVRTASIGWHASDTAPLTLNTPDAIKAHEGAQAAYLGASLGEAA